jgi:serine kinase of HPr protein (carbohydrate metabolism regulator)
LEVIDMAVLKDVKEKLALTLLTEEYDEKRKVADATVCDLLSWVMAHGCADMAWITVQTHMNVLAVASLHDFACVIIPEGIKVPGETIDKANEKKITLFSSAKTAYQICRGLSALGVGDG